MNFTDFRLKARHFFRRNKRIITVVLMPTMERMYALVMVLSVMVRQEVMSMVAVRLAAWNSTQRSSLV